MVILVQNSRRIFCYFNFEILRGLWLKLYMVEGDKEEEINMIRLNQHMDSLYIDLDSDNMRVFAKLGYFDENNVFIVVDTSNAVLTPCSDRAEEKNIKLIDISIDQGLVEEITFLKPENADFFEKLEREIKKMTSVSSEDNL